MSGSDLTNHRQTHFRWKLTEHVPAPAEHRGPDTVTVFEDNGVLYCYDRAGSREAWLTYQGPTTEVIL